MSIRFLNRTVVAWSLFAMLELAFGILTTRGDISIGSELLYVLGEAAFWIIITPGLWWVLGQLDTKARSRVAYIAGCIAAFVVISGANAEWRRILLVAVGEKLTVPFTVTYLYFSDFNLLACGAVLLCRRMSEADSLLVARTKRVLSLRAQFAQARRSTLEAQLHPHFIFNALGTVAELVHESPSAAKRMLWHLAELLKCVTNGTNTAVRFEDELRSADAYVEIQKLRFADWLTIESNIDPLALDVVVPRLILQPMIENAVRHGLTGRTGRGVISIDARIVKRRLRMRVTDNGAGLRPHGETAGHGVGLANLRQRLGAEYGSNFTVELESSGVGGTTALIEVPADHEWPTPSVGSSVADSSSRWKLFELLRRYPVTSTAVAWMVWGAFWLQQSVTYMLLRHRWHRGLLGSLLLDHAVAVILWFVLTPIALYACRRWPVGMLRARTLIAHSVAAAAFATLHAIAWMLLSRGQTNLLSQGQFSTILLNVLLYGAVVMILQIRISCEHRFLQENAAERLVARIHEERLAAATCAFQPAHALAVLERLANGSAKGGGGLERGVLHLAEEMRAMLDAARVAQSSTTPLMVDA